MLKEIEYLELLFFTFSFAGWLFESVGGIYKEKKFINRGFLIGPYCPVYGIGVVFITLILSKYKSDLYALFILSATLCGSLEYMTSYIMEKLFKARWWDYHNMKFNINGRICLETLIPFGIFGCLIIQVFNPFLYSKFDLIPDLILNVISISLASIFVIDFIISLVIISSFKDAVYNKKDNTEEISNKVKEKTDELSEIVLNKAEYTLMKMELNALLTGRMIKVRGLKIGRKVKYTRKRIIEKVSLKSITEISNEFKNRRDSLKASIEERKKQLDKQIKQKQEKIIETFKNRSILSKRLIEAFPKLTIKGLKNNNDLQKK